ncbi:uroporphyrinogen-III C-methyltransferase [uncultured Methylibium sp.]|uniref:uroporphyrinogen-III C-methyltransferase n=1 Tax=uncultured Methylibium sp. TaxID=381093 RepID=UPI0025D2C810|nr:uroporphyrinogen-III C-methyltransferase [uncultured Methylibium sp.]
MQTLAAGLAVLVGAAALAVAWTSQQRVQALEEELVRRQQASSDQSNEAQLLARQSQELSRDAVAKTALLESRVAELSVQRTQLEELIQSLSRSRDESLLVEIDAGVRVAMQQTAVTGSATPLVVALKAADERLARVNQPRLEVVRRAIARDLDRVKAVSVADIATLAGKLDEAARLVDEAPLLAVEIPRPSPDAKPARPAPSRAGTPAASAASVSPAAAASTAADPATPAADALAWLPAAGGEWLRGFWSEARGLLRVTRVDQPEAMLLAPEQRFFLRENLKLKLLNARLALLSRQFDTAQSDLRTAQGAIDSYFDRGARRTLTLAETVRSVAMQARQAGVPRPDDTLAALAAAGR